jgi:hypothetical protein
MQKPSLRTALVSAVLAFTAGPSPAQLFNFGSLVNSLGTAKTNPGANRNSGQEQDRTVVKQAAASFAEQHEEWARPLMTSLYTDGEWGAVLNFKRLGLAAMERQKFGLARRAFDEAILRVEEIYANDANAQKARSVFNAEAIKDFKGEPYERAMLYYYRGLLYVEEGDYQNSRASFLAADRHITLSSAEAASFTSDFGMLKYLAGWASHCDNDIVRGDQLLEEARAMDSKVQALPAKPADSVVLVESGPAPVKWGDGEYKQILKFKPGDSADISPQLRTGNGKLVETLPVAGDIVYQATTRGGREVDGIMAGKASFKGTAATVGNVAMEVGTQAMMMSAVSGNRDMANAGLAGMFIGLVAKGVEKAANPAADTRFWDGLPARVHLVTDKDIASGKPVLLVNGQPQPMTLLARQGRCSLAWARTTVSTPVASVTADPQINPEANRGDRNKVMREALAKDFVASN